VSSYLQDYRSVTYNT